MNKTAIALGTFDGLHKGHIQVINNTVRLGKELNLDTAVMLFDVHPLSVTNGVTVPRLITDPDREKLLNELGAKAVRFEFKKIVNYSKNEFFYDILIKQLKVGAVSCGENFRFGKNASGNVDYLKQECEKNGIVLSVSPIVSVNGQPVSSTKIRSLIQSGEIERANEMLGRYFSFSSKVLDGKHLGRKLGVPTVNQTLEKTLVEPKKGVYFSFTVIDGKRYKSITNIGLRPTVENTENVNSETHILSFNGNLYGTSPTVELVSFLRDEKKFESVEQLREQIERDIYKRKISESE